MVLYHLLSCSGVRRTVQKETHKRDAQKRTVTGLYSYSYSYLHSYN